MGRRGTAGRRRTARWARHRLAAIGAAVLVAGLLPATPALAVTVTVTTFADVVDGGDGVISLREAITTVNGAGAGIHMVLLPPGEYPLTLGAAGDNANAGGDLDLTNGTDALIILRGDGGNATIRQTVGDRVLDLHNGADAFLDRITIRGGRAAEIGGGIRVVGNASNLRLDDSVVTDNIMAVTGTEAAQGGGINYQSPGGTLTLVRSRIVGNLVQTTGSGTPSGGGIHLDYGELVITDSAIDDNEARGSSDQATGGGLYAWTNADVTITRSAITRNRAHSTGAVGLAAAAALWQGGGNTMVARLTNVTIAGNESSHPDGGALNVNMSSGASTVLDHVTIAGNATAGLQYTSGGAGAFGLSTARSLFGGNAGGPDCLGDVLGSAGYNRAESCPSLSHPNDLPAGPPGVAALVDAPVPYLPITESSAALDVIPDSPITEDTRTAPRPAGPADDIGAFELQGPVAVDDAVTVVAGDSVSFQPLANDDGGDGVLGSAVATSSPTKGTVEGGGAGAFTYTAAASATGTDSFTYEACLVIATYRCDSATVAVTITPPPEPVVRRVHGPDRYATAVAVSQDTFAPGVPAAYVATGEVFADALAGGPLAGMVGAPILLTTRDALPQVTHDELLRLKPGRIVVLGGAAAVSAAVAADLAALTTGQVDRLHGPDRYGTAAAIAGEIGAATTVYLATGRTFPDALAGAAGAGRDLAPILLTDPTTLPAATGTALDAIAPTTVILLGGPAAVSEAVADAVATRTGATVKRLQGPDRYATAAAVADTFAAPRTTVYIATGEAFPDALSGAPAAIQAGAPVVLIPPGGIPSTVAAALDRLDPVGIVVLGGTAALPDARLTDLAQHLRGN
jgi:putative cell wall-binding protein